MTPVTPRSTPPYLPAAHCDSAVKEQQRNLHKEDKLSRDSEEFPLEATSTAADLVNPRSTWDAHKPATRPDVFTVDVFELVALRWLSGEEVPKEYQTPIFHETVELARRYLPNLTLRSGCLYHNRTQSGQCVRYGVQEYVLLAAHSARMGGHYAVRGTLLKLNGIAWWPEIQVDVELLVCTCELCLHNKHVAHLDVKAH